MLTSNNKATTKRLTSLAAGLVLAIGIGVSTAEADRMGALFDSYSTGSSYSGRTEDGMVWSGGSFRGRWRQPNIELFSFQPPSLNVGCGGIDAFAGAFGMVSGDQLVQVARGLAQGAAVYLFKLAMNSICSSCATIMADVQKTLEKLNQLARNSCQSMANALETRYPLAEKSTSNMVTEATQAMSTWADGLGEENLATMTLDAFQLDGISNDAAQGAVDGNAVYQALLNADITHLGFIHSFAMGFSGTSDRQKLASFLMTMLGTQTSYAVEAGESCNSGESADGKARFCRTFHSPQLTFKSLILGDTADSNGKVKYTQLQCKEDEFDDPKCVQILENPNQEIEAFKPFAESVIKGTSADAGVLTKLSNRWSFSERQNRFQQLMPYPWVKVKEAMDAHGISDSVFEEYYILLFTYRVAKSVQSSMQDVYTAISKSSASGKSVDLLDSFKLSYKEFDAEANEVINQINQELSQSEANMKNNFEIVKIKAILLGAE